MTKKQSEFSSLLTSHEVSVACTKVRQFKSEDPTTARKLSIYNWKEDVKPLVTDKCEPEFRDESKYFLFVFLDCQSSNARISIHEYSLEEISQGIEMLIQPFIEEFKLLGLANLTFEKQNL